MRSARQITSSLLPKRLLNWGRQVVEHVTFPPDFDAEQVALFRQVETFTMTSPERLIGLCDAVNYIVDHMINGCIVECGVWRGGSMMAVAHTLRARHEERELYLFDTFEGMPPPSHKDLSWQGRSAHEMLQNERKQTGRNIWCIADREDVTRNLNSTGYNPRLIHLVPGKVEETLPKEAPEEIALLRLDTDWYESTKHELEHLYPRLVPGGVLILDDYGYWQGARRAVNEYFARHGPRPLLHRLDNTGRIAIKR